MLDNKYKVISKVTQERKVYFQEECPALIWNDVVNEDKGAMQDLCKAMSKLVFEVGVPSWLVRLSAKLLYYGVYKHWGHYLKESDYLASECADMSASLMAFLQRQYTLAHMGCSVVMTYDDKTEQMICFRSLDWKGADDIARATRRFSFINENEVEVAQVAGITGMVGVLTGTKKGFCIAINYAPWKRSAKFKSDPTFLIRKLLENDEIKTYQEAQKHIKTWKVGSPCFISLCGVSRGEACVIELGSDEQIHIREMKDEAFLIQTNHYELASSPFTQHNEEPYAEDMNEKEWYDSELLRNSQQRSKVLRKRLEESSDMSIEDRLISMYKEVPVLNWESAQWVLMKPKNGELEVFSCVDK